MAVNQEKSSSWRKDREGDKEIEDQEKLKPLSIGMETILFKPI